MTNMNLEQLADKIKESREKWGILTGNGFNLACEVKTDYQSLCKSLVASFSSDLSEEEINQLNKEFEDKEYNFELWLSEKQKEGYMEKIALKAIHRQWLVEFISACSQDPKQYFFSQKLNDFLDLFQYFLTLNVDPYFYRRCLGRKEQIDPPVASDENSQTIVQSHCTKAQTSVVNKTVFIGPKEDEVKEVDASSALKKSFQKKMGLLTEEDEEPKEINDGFSIRGKMEKQEVDSDNHNLFYLHGACHLKIINSSEGTKILKKLKANDERSLISSILEEDPDSNSSVFAGTSEEKQNKINANEYLKSQYDVFKEIECKDLVIYGVSLADNDQHIWNAIKENENIENLYISYYGDNLKSVKNASNRLFSNKNIKFFESKQFVESNA